MFYIDHQAIFMTLPLILVNFFSHLTGDFKRKSTGDKPSSTTQNSRPKFLSVRKKPAVGSSTTALIFENRPRYITVCIKGIFNVPECIVELYTFVSTQIFKVQLSASCTSSCIEEICCLSFAVCVSTNCYPL